VDAFGADPAAVAFDQDLDGGLVTYLGYTIEQPIAGADHLATAFRRMVAQSGHGGGIVGLEESDVTVLFSRVLRDTFEGEVAFESIDGWLEPLRMVKTGEEISKLRQNFALTDLGHATARQTVAAGKREIDIWTAIHNAIQQKAGQRVPLGNDCVVGRRQANIGGWPLDNEIRPNDSLIVDLSTLLHGYWSDSCATYYPDKPTPQQEVMHETVAEALEFATALIRPGAVAKEIDQKVRQFMVNSGYPVYPHHTGHGVGVSGHEGPRLVPYNEEVLEEGMIIMLEPGIYLPGETGVRLEDAMLVTSDGAEVLTHHNKNLPY
jgi:Xaa-Pro aminopeptidase